MPIVIPPNKLESTTRALVYLCLGVLGCWVILDPPNPIEGSIGWLTFVWGSCLLVSFAASVGAFFRRYRVEYMGLPLSITGSVIYTWTLWALVDDQPAVIPYALAISALSVSLITRLMTLHRLVMAWKEGPWIGSKQ